MTRNLYLILTTSALALTLVQHSAQAAGHHDVRNGGAAVASVKDNHKTGANLHAGHGEQAGSQAARRPAHAQPVTPHPVELRGNARVPRSGSVVSHVDKPVKIAPGTVPLAAAGATHVGIPGDLRSVIGPLGASQRISNLAAERSLHQEAGTLLTPSRNGTIEQSSMNRYVALNSAIGNTVTVTPAMGREKFGSVLGKLNSGIRTGDYRIVPVSVGTSLPGAPAGASGTIVVGQNENGKTVYVPASQLSGPDKRTIDVNCSDCKVVVVGDTAKGGGTVTDDRHIVVNGKGDAVVDRGDSANGAAGRNGGTVQDNRQITVNGSKDTVSSGGDSANGGNGANGKNGQRGQNGGNGGNGGTIDDNRRVIVNGNKDTVKAGTDSANGGNGGNGSNGIGGNGGSIADKRKVDNNGFGNRIRPGSDQANGGNGGNGF
jgi:hypothetical protein